jgi:hypothetical protein
MKHIAFILAIPFILLGLLYDFARDGFLAGRLLSKEIANLIKD